MKKVLLGLSAYATANEADAAWLTVIETVVLFVSNKNDSVKGGGRHRRFIIQEAGSVVNTNYLGPL